MSYPKKTLKLRPTRGLALDVPAAEVSEEFYTAGQNVIFRRGFASRVRGFRDVYAPALYQQLSSNIQHAINCPLNGVNYWLVFGDDEAHAVETSNSNPATHYDGMTSVAAPWHYSSALLNGIPIVTNGADDLMYWPGTGLLQTLPDWTATESCKSVAVHRYHVFALDIDGPGGTFPNLVKWSAAAEPGTVPASWTPAADNEAGSAELADGAGPLLCAVPLRDSLLIYKRSTIYAANYVGGNQVYAIQKLSASHGALNRRAVCDVGGQHFVVEQGDIVLTDGVNRQSVGQARMRQYLFDDLDQTYYENLFVIFNRAKGEVLICYPRSGSADGLCDAALVYDLATDALGVRDLPSISHAAIGTVNDETDSDIIDDVDDFIDDFDRVFNVANLAAATESLVFAKVDALEMQDTSDAQMVPASVGKYDLHFGNPERVKFVKRLHVRAESGFGTLLVRVGSRMTPTDSIAWSDEVTLTEPAQIVNVFAQGRYIAVEIRSNDTNAWTVNGIDIEAEMRGWH